MYVNVMVACTFSAPPNSLPPKGPLLGIGKEGKLVVVFSEFMKFIQT
jgi:hypothetical protein